ncbi:MAG: GntR family transcriptional regulator [Mycobacterium sp.]
MAGSSAITAKEGLMAFDSIKPMALTTAPGRIADVIRGSILDGTLAPGEQLTETQLAERLSVSRGPIREAMQRLVQEGLLWSKPHHGTFVVELGHEDAADIYLARRAVEGTAAIRVMGRLDSAPAFKALDQAVSELRLAVKSGEWAAIVSADIKFHEVLVSAAKSPRLSRVFSTLTAETRLCMAAFVEGHPDWLKRAVSQHRDLVAAIRNGDQAEVLNLLDTHFNLDEHLAYRGDVTHKNEEKKARA